MRSVGILLGGIVLGIVLILGWLALPRALGQEMTGPIGTMMGQMMGPEAMNAMMGEMMRDPRFAQPMIEACAQAMQDPDTIRRMQDAMNNPQMRRMMTQMFEAMREIMQGR